MRSILLVALVTQHQFAPLWFADRASCLTQAHLLPHAVVMCEAPGQPFRAQTPEMLLLASSNRHHRKNHRWLYWLPSRRACLSIGANAVVTGPAASFQCFATR
jgi:hypothetical protein